MGGGRTSVRLSLSDKGDHWARRDSERERRDESEDESESGDESDFLGEG